MFLSLYRPQLTSMLSLCHRVTGVAMALSKLFLIVFTCTLCVVFTCTICVVFTCTTCVVLTVLEGWYMYLFNLATKCRVTVTFV